MKLEIDKSTLGIVVKYWCTWVGPTLATMLLLLFIVGIGMSRINAIVIGTVIIGVWISWLCTMRVPINRKGLIGFVVAIRTENEEEEKKIASDFTETLRELLNECPVKFNLLELPNRHARRIKTNDNAARYLVKMKGHYIVYGRARKRKSKKNEVYILNLAGIVAHRPIQEEIHNTLRGEFKELFPNKVLIDAENDLLEFELTSDLISIVSKYIIGIAAYLSGDMESSRRLYERVRDETKSVAADFPIVNRIKARLPQRFIECNLTQAKISYVTWLRSRDIGVLDRMKVNLDELNLLDKWNIDANVLRAIYYFLHDRNIAAAREELERCHGRRDHIINCSRAFLYAYEGNLDEAYALYAKAFRSRLENTTYPEIEIFINEILREEPNEYQLHFCLGLINYYPKEDYVLAKEEFDLFIKESEEGRYVKQIEIAKQLLESIARQAEE